MAVKLNEVKLTKAEIDYLLIVIEKIPAVGTGTMEEIIALRDKLREALPKEIEPARAEEDA